MRKLAIQPRLRNERAIISDYFDFDIIIFYVLVLSALEYINEAISSIENILHYISLLCILVSYITYIYSIMAIAYP